VLGERRIGEIWIAGPNVTRGYWNNPELTVATFGARTSSGEGPFLRTGDLGFLEHGELHVTGRLKDLLIVNGRNHYPQDIEQTVTRCDDAFVGRPAAAFAVTENDREGVAVVQEVAKSFLALYPARIRAERVRDIKTRIHRVVATEHGIVLKRVLLVPQGTLPMTTSGKIERAHSRKLFLNGKLTEIWAPRASAGASRSAG
jgi:acyl-CoA synthetase (AMP-forming)/AMP-acid ligase II